MNPAYKHLQDRLRIGELTVGQLTALFCGVMGGLVFALYVSPFSPYLTLFISIYVASVPVGAVLLASTTEFDLWLYLRARLAYHVRSGSYAAGPGEAIHGYAILADACARAGADGELPTLDFQALWD